MALICLIKSLEDGDIYIEKLKKFNDSSVTKLNFPELSEEERNRFWASLFNKLNVNLTSCESKTILISIKILSRDKTNLSQLITDERVKILLKWAGLTDLEFDEEVGIEAVKCIYNMLMNNRETAKMFWNSNAFPNLIKRIESKKISYDVRKFDARLLFLVTNYYEPCCIIIYKEYNGFMIFCNIIKKELDEKCLSDKHVEFCSEILKIIFNILVNVKSSRIEKNDTQNLVCLIREVLLAKTKPQLVLHILHCINLLTSLPLEDLPNILVPGYDVTNNKHFEAVDVVVKFLDIQLTAVEEGKTYKETENESLSPVLVALHNLANSNTWIRKFIKSQILPSLKEFDKRPEEGSTLRNKLCRRLSSPMSSINDLVADLLFLLCKGSVSRVVKYTGLGNSAGYFARRGLMGRLDIDTTNFSDSDSSDTEEYRENMHLIDPVVGCKPNWKKEENQMTEEQKECLAIELVNQIDQLQKLGLIQPCKISENGKPEPIESIFDLQNDNVNIKYKNDDQH